MVATRGIRSGGRAKFRSPQDMQAAFKAATGNAAVEVEVVEAEFTLTHSEPSQGEAATRDVATTTTTLSRPSVTPASCVRALEKAIGFGKSALYLEVAVSLAVFATSSTGADRATKRVVMDIYSKAGFNTAITSEDYKTVNRRINASAALYQKLGREAVESAMHGLREGKAIDSLCSYLGETFNFSGINAVLEYAGKPVKQTNTPEVRAARALADGSMAAGIDISSRMDSRRQQAQLAAEEDSDGIIVSAGVLSLVIPRDCTAAAVRAMATKLMEFADRIDAEAGTPEEQRNREMHS